MIDIFKTIGTFCKNHPKFVFGLGIGVTTGLLGGLIGPEGAEQLIELKNKATAIPVSGTVTPSKSDPGFQDDYYKLMNLREERKHEERMAEIKARNNDGGAQNND